jgi:DNA-binding CsgD family transcriptional regulator
VLTAAFDAVARGDGSLAVVAGAAGSGKSALLAAAAERARVSGLAVRRARGTELEQELPFGVIRQLFEPLLRPMSASKRRRLLSGAAATTARLFDERALDHSAGGDGGFATLHGLYWLTAGIAADRPMVLAVDDVHWVDEPSLRALNYLAERIGELPAALVVAFRPHEPTAGAELVDGLECHPAARRVDLSPLTAGAVAEVVRAAHPQADDALCAAFSEASAGNPFYLRELLRSVGAADRSMPRADEVRDAAVASVGDRVLKRISALGSAAPELAAGMSVLGATGRLEHAAALAQQDVDAAAAAALAMRRAEILAAEDPFEWIHPLVRRSIYDSLTVTHRDQLHARAAELLADAGAPSDIVATHLSAQRPTRSRDVVAGLLSAADEALSRDAPEVAVTHLNRALEEQAPDPPRPTLLLKLGQIEVARRNPQAAEILREVRQLSRDPRERALAAISLGEILTNTGQFQASAEVIVGALEELDGSDPELGVELEVVRAVIFAFDPALAPGLWRDRDRLLALTHRDGWAPRALSALLALTFALRGEALEDVPALCDRAMEDGRLLSERGAGAWASAHVLGALATIEAYDRVAVVADQLETAARSQGSIANALVTEGYRGWVAARRGDLARAEEIFRPLVETAQGGGMFLYLVTALWWAGDAIHERPSLDDLAALTESVELPPPLTEVAGGAWPLAARGRVRAARGALGAAAEDLRAAGRIFGALGFGPMHDPWRSRLALTLPPESADEARALVDEELMLADATGFARPRGIALRASGLLAGGDEGIELLRQSADLLADSPARYEHALSLVELGAALRRTGRRADSREPLVAGMELASRCGAERLVAHAREELLAAGARPRRIARSGFDGLTASERRIIRLAAEGRSNPEIAQALFVSLKTVESHLSNAYSKLGVSGPGARRRLSELIANSDRLTAAA